MKKLGLCILLVGGSLFQGASAQLKINLNINIGNQPIWGPTGHDHVEYYYLPQYDVYYDVPRHQYIYWEGGRQVFAPALPPRYHVDLYKTYKVVLNEPNAYQHHSEHVRQYAKYKTRHDQPVIRNSHDSKYFEIKDHPEHSKWKGHDQPKGHPQPKGHEQPHGQDHDHH